MNWSALWWWLICKWLVCDDESVSKWVTKKHNHLIQQSRRQLFDNVTVKFIIGKKYEFSLKWICSPYYLSLTQSCASAPVTKKTHVSHSMVPSFSNFHDRWQILTNSKCIRQPDWFSLISLGQFRRVKSEMFVRCHFSLGTFLLLSQINVEHRYSCLM